MEEQIFLGNLKNATFHILW